jgi:hypothetical protein
LSSCGIPLSDALWYTPADVRSAGEGLKMREERETMRALLVVNTVRGALGAKPISLKELYAPPQAPTGAEEMAEIMNRFNRKPEWHATQN